MSAGRAGYGTRAGGVYPDAVGAMLWQVAELLRWRTFMGSLERPVTPSRMQSSHLNVGTLGKRREIPLCAGRRFRKSESGRKSRPAPFGMTVWVRWRGTSVPAARWIMIRGRAASRQGLYGKWREIGRRLGEESEERFLSAQTDAFGGAKAEEKVGLLRSK